MINLQEYTAPRQPHEINLVETIYNELINKGLSRDKANIYLYSDMIQSVFNSLSLKTD